MNKVHRIVWNECVSAWVAVSEITKGRGKSSARVLRRAALAGLLVLGTCETMVRAEQASTTAIPTGGGNTTAYVAPNGVTVINIATANSSGVSHNFFGTYNVGPEGTVLNNANQSLVSRMSQLAGLVIANPNLVNEARVILNEVVSTNRSLLQGFTEVLGGRADVIVANPNGITCNGCGFINTDRVTLTTGVPYLTGVGAVGGFNVGQGDLLITGLGANAKTQQIFDLVARSIKIDGDIVVDAAGSLGLAAGANNWSYSGRNVLNAAPAVGVAPVYAIDSTAVGGMYAGRINIIATDAGVGVRMLGDAAASADDFTLNSAGKVEIQSSVSAQRNSSISTTSATGVQDLHINGARAKISANNDLAISAGSGQVQLTDGELFANNNLSLAAASLNDVSTTATKSARFAKMGGNSVTTTGAASFDGARWAAGQGALNGSFGSLSVGALGALFDAATTISLTSVNDMSLATAAVRSIGNLSLTSTSGLISTAADAAQGIQSTTGDINLTAGAGLTNAGVITSDAGSITARVSGTLNNSGTVYAKTVLDIADQNGAATQDLLNTGTILADGSITAKATNVTNQVGASIQGTQGTTLAATSLTNHGAWIASSTAGQVGTFTVDNLTNSGVLQSVDNLIFNVTTSFNNSGKLLATQDVSILAGASALAMSNAATGVIQAGRDIFITGNNAVFNAQAGTVQADRNLSFTLSRLTNSGTVVAKEGSNVSVAALLDNSGLFVVSDTTGFDGVFSVGSLNNSSTGVIQSANNLTVNVAGTGVTNANKLVAANNLSITSTGTGMTLTNAAGAFIQAGSNAGNKLTINGAAVTLNNQAGATLIGDQLDFALSSLSNAGIVQGGSSSGNIAVTGTFNNSGTLTLSNSATSASTITADTLLNSGTFQSKGAATLNVATALTNSAKLLTDGDLFITGSDSSYSINNTDKIQSGALLTVQGQGAGSGVDVSISSGASFQASRMNVKAASLSLADNAMLSSLEDMTLNANSLNFGGITSRIVAATTGTGMADVTVNGAFSNIGAIHSGRDMVFRATSVNNTNTGGFSALNDLTVNATSGNFDNSGALYAGNMLTATSTGTFTNKIGTGTVDSSGSVSIAAATFDNQNTVNASQNITISAGTFKNDVAGGDTRYWQETHNSGAYKERTDVSYADAGFTRKTRDYWQQDRTMEQFYGTTPGFKPQIIAGNTLTIKDFNNATNIGGVISGNAVNITGSGTFTNNDLSLNRQTWKRTWEYYTEDVYTVVLGWENVDDHLLRNDQPDTKIAEVRKSAIGAGIFSNTLNASGFNLVNESSPAAAAPQTKSATGGSASALAGAATGTGFVTGYGAVTATGAPAVVFGGLVIALPTNPNGFFVVSKNPQSRYLIETNPLFATNSPFVGSDYMAKRYGINPDDMTKRLGDANYEAFLIKQQLIGQTTRNILAGYATEAEQMQALMDHGADQAKSIGLAFGVAPTADQLAQIRQDMVWMVEDLVAGQKVLVPRVYLADETKLAIDAGAVIEAKNATFDLASMTNTGGTIEGSESLSLVSQGDITNTSGTIKGGKVKVKSVSGSIKNETKAETSSGTTFVRTVIGKTAGIEATGDLELDAAQNITVKGADVKAGGDVSLAAGKDITFDTIVDKSADRTSSVGSFGMSSTITDTTTEKNIGSKLSAGGNLKIKSGGDTTLAGTKADAGGNLNVDTGGDFKVIARQDKTTTKSVTDKSGIGVGGGMVGSQTTTVDDFEGKNFGSSLEVAGNAQITAAGKFTLQGSDLTVDGDATIDASRGVDVLDGLDEKVTTTKVETTTFMKMDNEGDAKAQASASKNASSNKSSRVNKAGASAQASAEAEGTSDLKLSETTTETTKFKSKTSVASNLKVGGNLKATSKEGAIKIQGSNVEAGGDLELDAKNVEVLAGRSETTEDVETKTTSVGIYNEGDAKAEASASADARAGGGGRAKADASASAEAQGTTTIGSRTTDSSSNYKKVTNTASTLKSGGNMKIKAQETAKFQGADVEAAGNLDIEARDIINVAAKDEESTKTNSQSHLAGLYIDADAAGEAEASGGTSDMPKAGASGEANASAGLRYKNTKESSFEGSTTNTVSSFKAGGNVKRTASNLIEDHGTQIEAGGDIEQSAREIKEVAVVDTETSSESATSHDGKIGVGASASAEASSSGDAGEDAGAGLRAKYKMEDSDEKLTTTTAVTSKYKAGGNIKSKSENKTTLIGTQMEAGGDVEIEAQELDFQAARDTSDFNSNSMNVDAQVKVDLVGAAGASLDAAFDKSKSKDKESTAVTGSIAAGGNLKIKTKSNASFEGVNLEAEGAASLDVGGKLDFNAAFDTSSGESQDINASLSVGTKKEGGEKSMGVGFGYAQGDSSSRTAQVGSIKAGKGGINLKAGGDANFEGTGFKSTGDVSIEAGGDVNLRAAKSTEKDTSFSLSASAGGGKSDDGSSEKSGAIAADVGVKDKIESKSASLDAGGKINIKGKTVLNQEASLKAAQGTTIDGKEVKVAAEKRDVDFEFGMSAQGNSKKEGASTPGSTPKAGSKTTDDLPSNKADTGSDGPARSKTTDDLPSKSKEGADAKPQTAEEKAATRKKTIDDLKADKAKLDAATAKKKNDKTQPKTASSDKAAASGANQPSEAAATPKPDASSNGSDTATNDAKPAAVADAKKTADEAKAAERKKTIDALKADKAKLDAVMAKDKNAATPAKPAAADADGAKKPAGDKAKPESDSSTRTASPSTDKSDAADKPAQPAAADGDAPQADATKKSPDKTDEAKAADVAAKPDQAADTKATADDKPGDKAAPNESAQTEPAPTADVAQKTEPEPAPEKGGAADTSQRGALADAADEREQAKEERQEEAAQAKAEQEVEAKAQKAEADAAFDERKAAFGEAKAATPAPAAPATENTLIESGVSQGQ